MDTRTDRMVQAGGLTLHVQTWGRADSQPLLCLHGLASSSHMFDLIAPALSQTYFVIAVDQRGHGLSDKPDDGYDFETLACDLDALVESLSISSRLLVMGHSWGAWIALYYAATRPEHVARLVLLDGGVRSLQDQYPTWAEAEVGMQPPAYTAMTLADIRDMIRSRWLRDFYRPELQPLALSIFDQSDPANIRPHLSHSRHMRIAHHLWAFQATDYWPRLQCPVLAIHATSSSQPAKPQLDERIQQAEALARPGLFRNLWMAETAHDIPWHRPHELTALLEEFLSVL